jgi:hypothetical protein
MASPVFIVSNRGVKSILRSDLRGLTACAGTGHNWDNLYAPTANPVISRRVLLTLLLCSTVLPMAIVVVVAVARLLAAMQDAAGAAVLDRVALALGILWAVNLISLLIALALVQLMPPDDRRP